MLKRPNPIHFAISLALRLANVQKSDYLCHPFKNGRDPTLKSKKKW
jgi:hypothetical protein